MATCGDAALAIVYLALLMAHYEEALTPYYAAPGYREALVRLRRRTLVAIGEQCPELAHATGSVDSDMDSSH